MISRVAESCFWLHRYVERMENTARLLRVHRSFNLDLDLETPERWYPLVIVSGEQERFLEYHDPSARDDAETIQEYLTWSDDCPVSIRNSARWARENARQIREVISPDLWEALNSFWHWLRGGSGRRTYRANRDAFYERVKQTADLFNGVSHNTMLHEEPFDFMRLGMLLERVGQTARILDVKHHTLGPRKGQVESAIESAQWAALLQCCGATELFFKRAGGGFSGLAVARFLVKENVFPRSILHCLDRSWNFHRRVRPPGRARIGSISGSMLKKILDHVKSLDVEKVLREGQLHSELTGIIDATAGVCAQIRLDFFDPPVPRSPQRTAR